MDEPGGAGLGAVLADMGANLVTVLLILLAISLSLQGAAQQAQDRAYPAQVVPTLSGRAQSDLLFERLRPSPDMLLIEVTRQGVRWIDGGSARPLSDLPAVRPRRAVVFVLSPAQYGPLRDATPDLPSERVEMTVPEALQRQDGTGFSEAFLSIRPGPDPASIRPELRRLLLQGGLGRTAADAATGGADASAGVIARLGAGLRLMGNLTLLVVTLGFLRWLWRRTRVVS